MKYEPRQLHISFQVQIKYSNNVASEIKNESNSTRSI